MLNMDDQELLEEFVGEAKTSLEEAELALLALDRGEEFEDHYKEIFRTFHSIKGAAGMFGIDPVQKLFHHLENLLESTKEKKELKGPLADYFLQAIDIAPRMIVGEAIDFPLIDPTQTPSEVTGAKSDSEKEERMEELFEAKTSSVGIVYIVDDEEDLLMALEDMVSDAGFDVKTFNRAKDLLAEVKKVKPDVILSDVKMPEMTGIELQKAVNEYDPEIPVFILSGYLDKSMVLELSANGVYGILEKPIFDETQLQIKLKNEKKKYKSIRLIDKSIKFIMYQFSDLDAMLKEQGKESLRQSLKSDLDEILRMRQDIKKLK
ncbi:MAG: response regulator [Bdellovibrionales bacterium]|nr:response regulator [Bdellovibrionales bacterium]